MDFVNTTTTNAVVVNGAGPVGLTMACELARHGVEVRIFDKNAEAATQSRALAIFPRTLEVFHAMGMIDGILAEGQKLEGFSMYNDSKRLAHLEFQAIESPYPFAISLPQSRTERILGARLEELGVKVERGMELVGMSQDGDGVHARYRRGDGTEEILDGKWMLGCDGAHSGVRHLLRMTFQGAQYDEQFLLADVRVESDLETDQGHLFFSKEGIFAYFPYKGGRARLIANQRPGTPHDGAEPDMAEIEEIVRRRCSPKMQVSDPVWKAWFNISHRMVEHYAQGRAYLAGDAAHIHSPAGGQGMNTGIQDAFNLAWKIALVAHGVAGPRLLESYEAERMPVALSVVNLTDRMTRAATAQTPVAQPLRDLLLPLLAGIPVVKEAMAERLSEVGIDYRKSEWVENRGLGVVRAGDRAPDVVLYDRGDGVERRVFDLLRTPGFVLLVFEGYEEIPIGQGLLSDFPGKTYRIRRPGCEVKAGTLEDRDCLARKVYGAGEEGLLVLIRPDGYVGFRGESVEALRGYLERLKG